MKKRVQRRKQTRRLDSRMRRMVMRCYKKRRRVQRIKRSRRRMQRRKGRKNEEEEDGEEGKENKVAGEVMSVD